LRSARLWRPGAARIDRIDRNPTRRSRKGRAIAIVVAETMKQGAPVPKLTFFSQSDRNL
jgi:hypothetical protein